MNEVSFLEHLLGIISALGFLALCFIFLNYILPWIEDHYGCGPLMQRDEPDEHESCWRDRS